MSVWPSPNKQCQHQGLAILHAYRHSSLQGELSTIYTTQLREDNCKLHVWNFLGPCPMFLLLLILICMFFTMVNCKHKNKLSASSVSSSKLANPRMVSGSPELAVGVRSEDVLGSHKLVPFTHYRTPGSPSHDSSSCSHSLLMHLPTVHG